MARGTEPHQRRTARALPEIGETLAHTTSLSQLQNPGWALVNGELVRYEDVRIHISAEALTRALSVFEGVKGYWDSPATSSRSGALGDITTGSADLRRCSTSQLGSRTKSLLAGLSALAEQLLVPIATSGSPHALRHQGTLGRRMAADLVVTAFTQQMHDPDPMRLGVSTWRHAADVALPTRVKSSANYVGARLARIEVHRLGYDDAVLLNDAGRVAEATGASS